jgi:osmotically inducible lipoprotein OsmB
MNIKTIKTVFALGLSAVMLAGCGTSPGDRGLSGGILGAGTGAAIGSLAGSAGTGALIGGLGGAAIGLLTSPDQINLGPAAWNRSASSSHSRRHARRYARSDCSTRETATQRITTCAKATKTARAN